MVEATITAPATRIGTIGKVAGSRLTSSMAASVTVGTNDRTQVPGARVYQGIKGCPARSHAVSGNADSCGNLREHDEQTRGRSECRQDWLGHEIGEDSATGESEDEAYQPHEQGQKRSERHVLGRALTGEPTQSAQHQERGDRHRSRCEVGG